MSEIKIDTDIPLPKRLSRRPLKYPYDQMQVGNSIYVTVSFNSIYQLAMGWAKREKNKRKFIAKQEGEGSRLWRVK